MSDITIHFFANLIPYFTLSWAIMNFFTIRKMTNEYNKSYY